MTCLRTKRRKAKSKKKRKGERERGESESKIERQGKTGFMRATVSRPRSKLSIDGCVSESGSNKTAQLLH